MPEPVVRPGGEGATAPAERLSLRYPDGPHDAETLLVDPRRGDLYLVTKRADGRSGVYRAAAPLPFGGRATLRRVGDPPARAHLGGHRRLGLGGGGHRRRAHLRLGVRVGPQARGGPRGRRSPGGPAGPRRRWYRERQGEAVALLPDGRGFLTVSEGPRSPVLRYTARGGPR